MIYVTSDIHGNFEKYTAMLEKLSLTDGDALFVLGDVIDIGADGIKILSDMRYRTNIYPVLGEHEAMAKAILPKLMTAEKPEQCAELLNKDELRLLSEWLKSGAQHTLTDFLALDPEDKESIADYLGEFEPYEEIECAGRSYVLVHAGIRGFDKDKELSEYSEEDFYTEKADYSKVYYKDRFLVSGHVPTERLDPACKGKVCSKRMHLELDCAASEGGRLAAVCLDPLKVFYF